MIPALISALSTTVSTLGTALEAFAASNELKLALRAANAAKNVHDIIDELTSTPTYQRTQVRGDFFLLCLGYVTLKQMHNAGLLIGEPTSDDLAEIAFEALLSPSVRITARSANSVVTSYATALGLVAQPLINSNVSLLPGNAQLSIAEDAIYRAFVTPNKARSISFVPVYGVALQMEISQNEAMEWLDEFQSLLETAKGLWTKPFMIYKDGSRQYSMIRRMSIDTFYARFILIGFQRGGNPQILDIAQSPRSDAFSFHTLGLTIPLVTPDFYTFKLDNPIYVTEVETSQEEVRQAARRGVLLLAKNKFATVEELDALPSSDKPMSIKDMVDAASAARSKALLVAKAVRTSTKLKHLFTAYRRSRQSTAAVAKNP